MKVLTSAGLAFALLASKDASASPTAAPSAAATAVAHPPLQVTVAPLGNASAFITIYDQNNNVIQQYCAGSSGSKTFGLASSPAQSFYNIEAKVRNSSDCSGDTVASPEQKNINMRGPHTVTLAKSTTAALPPRGPAPSGPAKTTYGWSLYTPSNE